MTRPVVVAGPRLDSRPARCVHFFRDHVDRLFLVLGELLMPPILWLLLLVIVPHGRASYETQGPSFVTEPLSRVEFMNVNGGRVDCNVKGNPEPTVTWLAADGSSIASIAGVRHVLRNGTVHFPAFEAEAFRQDVHWAIYRCSAVNSVGAVVSRDVTVRAVVNQRYDPEVQSPGGFIGNNVLLRCNIPSFVRDHVTVTSWLQEPSFNIYPSVLSDGKYHMLPSGELMIINITRSDAQMTYRCRTHHRLIQETIVSSNVGRIQLSEIRSSMPPILNEKLVYKTVRAEDTVVIPCVAYANPRPSSRWYQRLHQRDEPLEETSENFLIRDDTLIVQGVQEKNAGTYVCVTSNTEGRETLEVRLTVSAPLSVHVQPAVQTVDIGKPAYLTCNVNGFPQAALYWLKDAQPLRTGVRVRMVSRERISVVSVAREDRGMYQCFVRNEYEMAQGIAELRLGEIAPQLVYKFIEQTMQPGPSVSLKCSATGNPTPQISWLLDGFPLPGEERFLIGQYVTVYGNVISHVNISSVKREDGGEYECTASSRAGESKHSARLNIYGLPYVREMSNVTAIAGKQLHIKCPVAGYPIDRIVWEKDGMKLPTNMRQRVANGTMLIDTVQRDADQGVYTCIARNKYNSTAQRSVNIRVKVPPKISPFSFARDLNVGDRTGVQCVVASGDLPLTFTWFKDNQLMYNSSAPSPVGLEQNAAGGVPIVGVGKVPEGRGESPKSSMTISHQVFDSTLNIGTIAPAHNGTYTCQVTNGAATAAHSALLHVNVPPRISPFYFEDRVTEGMRTQLMCSTSEGDPPFNITWLMENRPIRVKGSDVLLENNQGGPESDSIQINDYSSFSSILTIKSVTSKHSGNYTCQISNVAGMAEHSTSLSVAVPPRWTVEPIDQTAIVGHGVSVACQAKGFPIPTVTWKQSAGETPGDYRELGYRGTESAGVAVNGSLVIPRVTREHAGFYLCQANNGVGPGLSKLIRLTVHAGPKVTVRTKQESVKRGETIALRCTAEGDPPLEVSWRARGNRIDPTYDIRYSLENSVMPEALVSALVIREAGHADRGEYTCTASNAYGYDKATVHLVIQEPPNFPRNLHVAEQGSRSILLAWSTPSGDLHPLYPDTPILNYVVQYKEAQDVWRENNSQKLVAGGNTVALVAQLKPATTYHFRVFAENQLGMSAPSDILHVQTNGEVPSGAPKQVTVEPLSSQQLRITWQPPDRSLWNGELLGYIIEYRNLGDDEQSINTTRVGITGSGDSGYDHRLTGLKKHAQYSIVVKAFNNKGDGPGSDPVVAQTHEDAPSAPPQNVTCVALNAQNIQVTWKSPPLDKIHGNVQGYKLLYEATSEEASIELQSSPETKVTRSLSTVLYSLNPYTNYAVQVLAYTRAGEGVSSSPISCTTEETVPDIPERVKAVTRTEDTVVISWLPPKRRNGILTKYTVYIRVLDQGQEVRTNKGSVPVQNLHYDAVGLKPRESYEAWVTASTKVGEGGRSRVIKLQLSTTIPASIISFGIPILVPWRVDVDLPCLFVGDPRPTVEWRFGETKVQKQQRLEIGSNNTLILRNVQRLHEGNYSCHVRNSLGVDQIIYKLQVQVPPAPPTLSATGATTEAVQLQWTQGDNGGASIKGFLLAYRKEFAEWEEVTIDRRAMNYQLDGLQCGTRYQFTLAAFNRIGSGSASKMETAKTKGSKPVPPAKQHLIKTNITSVILELAEWQDGGCALLHFVIEYRRPPGDWLLVSNNVPPQSRFPIVDLESETNYELRVTGYNDAGSTQAEYLFATLSPNGGVKFREAPPVKTEKGILLYLDAHVLAPSVISILAVILAVVGVCFCLKTHPGRTNSANDPPSQTQAALDNKHNAEQREQYYATVKKPGQQSPCREVSTLERIPEYSEDIYPYATFHLPEQENLASNPIRQALFYERSETMLQGAQCNMDQYSKVRGRARRKSKSFKSESEEYDTLGSDSDTEVGTSSRTESSNHLDESGQTSILARSPGPNAGPQRGREQRLALVPRPVHHNVLYHTHESSTSTEPSPISERKTFPRLEKQRIRDGPPDVPPEQSRGQNVSRPTLKLSESGTRCYSVNVSPSHPINVNPSCASSRAKEASTRKSIDSLCPLERPSVPRNCRRNASSKNCERHEDWDNELSTLELKPPSAFTDAHETSEAECDIDMKLKVHRKKGSSSSNSLSKSPKDFTITV